MIMLIAKNTLMEGKQKEFTEPASFLVAKTSFSASSVNTLMEGKQKEFTELAEKTGFGYKKRSRLHCL